MNDHYEKVKYSKSQIKKAGSIIANNSFKDISEEYIKIVDNWRAAHAFPLDKAFDSITKLFVDNKQIKIVKRLKKLSSIISKLKRENNSGLYRMQDLGGCRVIIPEISDYKMIVERIKDSLRDAKFIISRENDYIKNPRLESGYRSYHIIAKLINDENTKHDMFIEIQVRTKLQHSWATAIEIVDVLTNQNIKAGIGNEKYIIFFKYVSALFAKEEHLSRIKNVPLFKKSVIKKIYEIDKEESIRDKLSAYNHAIKSINKNDKDSQYFILKVDIRTRMISVASYKKEEINEAIMYYHYLEKTEDSKGKEIVFVSADNLNIIKEAYSNYFIDTNHFLFSLSNSCSSFPEKVSIPFKPETMGENINNYFSIAKYKATKKYSELDDDEIGITNSNIIFCPTESMTLEKSYLRFSGVGTDNSIYLNDIKPIVINGESIVVLKTGASYYLNKGNWLLYSNVDFILIQNKRDNDNLLFLLAWLKSNICCWDILYNKSSNSICNKGIYNNFHMPKTIMKDYVFIVEKTKKILEKEKEFVNNFNKNRNSISINYDELITNFNNSILIDLLEIEDSFCNYYRIKKNWKAKIKKDIEVKGYFSYR